MAWLGTAETPVMGGADAGGGWVAEPTRGNLLSAYVLKSAG